MSVSDVPCLILQAEVSHVGYASVHVLADVRRMQTGLPN